MKKILLIPDSFKGTMSSSEVCKIMKDSIQPYFPEANLISIPVADGGEGSVDSFLAAAGGEKIWVDVKGPHFETVKGFYGRLTDGTAVIEMAAAAGLPLAGDNPHVETATTYGVGQLILHAVQSGCRKVIIGLGGSATNDGGAGAASALGIRFQNLSGKVFVPVGDTLSDIDSINFGSLIPELAETELITMCDIDNPLCGPQGAAAVFGPQKGADAEMVKKLDRNLACFADVLQRETGKDIRGLPGSGAAGGMGGGMAALFHSKLQMGIETVLDVVHFDQLLCNADLVISGEGKLDSQSLRGKVIIGVAHRTKGKNVPLMAVVGDIGDHTDGIYKEGVAAVFSTNRKAVPFSEAQKTCRSDLAHVMDNIMRLLSCRHTADFF